MFSMPLRHLVSGLRFRTPSPEQGTSRRTRSADLSRCFMVFPDSISLVSMLNAPHLLALSLRSLSFHSSTSMAMIVPFPFIRAARCMVLPPEPEQESMTRIPGSASRNGAMS